MDASDDFILLDEYAATGSHAAFDALVKRHANFVYGTARRRVGSADLADDVTQATFIVLARKAKSIHRGQSLAAWLYRVARYAAIDALRRQSARTRHERHAAKPEGVMIRTTTGVSDDTEADTIAAVAPHLDAALDRLPARDREAILLRYFTGHTLEQIGRAQNVAASTVQRRIEKSLARLGHDLRRRGVTAATPLALSATLAGVAMLSAPPSATAGVTALATAAGALPLTTAGPIGLAKGTLHTMTMIKFKIAAAVVAAAVTIGAGGIAIQQAFAQNPPPAAPSAAPAQAPDLSPATPEAFARQFRFDWQSVGIGVRQYNAAADERNRRTYPAGVSIEADAAVLDTHRIIGFDRFNTLDVTRVVDESGQDLTAALAQPAAKRDLWFGPLNYSDEFDQALNQFVKRLRPQNFTVTLNIDPRLPKRIARVDGFLDLLVCEKIEHVDVPFVAASQNGQAFTDIIPGVRMRFDSAESRGRDVSYSLNGDSSGTRGTPTFNGQVTPDRPLPERMILNRVFVDADGKPVTAMIQPFGNFDGGGSEGGTRTLLPGASPVAAMRVNIGVGLRQIRLPVSLSDIDLPALPNLPNLQPNAAAAHFVPPLVEGGSRSFVAIGRLIQDNGTGLSFHLAMDGPRQLVVVSDVADGTPLIIADGRRTLLYDVDHGVRFIDNSHGYVRMDYDPASEKRISFATGVTIRTGTHFSTEPMSWMRFERVPGTPTTDGPKRRVTVDRPSAIDTIETLVDEPNVFTFTSMSKTDGGQIRVRATHIGEPIAATALDFPDVDRLANDIAVERVTTINLPAVIKELQTGSFLTSRLEANAKSANDERTRRDAVQAINYRNALAKQGFTEPRLSASPQK